MRPLADIIDWS